ncbi:MAG: nitrogen fixation protein [Pseudolabrys sp.]|jgi:predicted Fe-Mo cluster-binding NifX family protein
MIIAVASQNFRTVTPHAGRTRRFVLFEAVAGKEPTEIGRLDLPKNMAFHEFAGEGPHPLERADVVLAGSAGPGFARKMAARGIVASVTTLADPVEAVRRFLAEGPVSPTAIAASDCACHREHAGTRD